MATITGSNLYEINKELIKKEPTLSISDIKAKKKLIDDFFEEKKDRYFMLLCKEKADYTLFDFNNGYSATEATNILTDECLANRGSVKGIDLTQDKSAIEIWLDIDGEIYCYYLFPCDDMVV